MDNLQLSVQFFLQIAVILACCRIAGMVVPFVLGAALAWFLKQHTDLFPERTSALGAGAIDDASAWCLLAVVTTLMASPLFDWFVREPRELRV